MADKFSSSLAQFWRPHKSFSFSQNNVTVEEIVFVWLLLLPTELSCVMKRRSGERGLKYVEDKGGKEEYRWMVVDVH